MFKDTITYTDYNDEVRTEDYWFNMSKAEVMEYELSVKGGITETIKLVCAEQDHPKIFDHFKNLITKSYGKKSVDGKRFIKNQEVLDDFMESEAYSIFMVKLVSDSDFAAKWVNGMLPSSENKETPATIAAFNSK